MGGDGWRRGLRRREVIRLEAAEISSGAGPYNMRIPGCGFEPARLGRAIVGQSCRRPRLILCAAAAITAAAALFVPRVTLQLDGRSLVPAGDPSLAESDSASRRFELRDTVLLGVADEAHGIYSPAALGTIYRIGRELQRTRGIVPDSVISILTAPRVRLSGEVIETTPLGGSKGALDEAAARRIRREAEASVWNGMLVARDGRAAAIAAEVEPEADRAALLANFREIARRETLAGHTVYVSGAAAAQAVLGNSAARDLLRELPLVILALGGVLMLAFRHPAPAIISLSEILMSVLWTAGLMGLTGQSIFVTTLVLPVILVAVGVSDDVYALCHCFEGLSHSTGPVRDIVDKEFRAVARPIGVTAASTIIGLLSMALTGLEPLRVFGIFGSLAIAFSTLFTFTLVPAMTVLLVAPARAAGRGARGFLSGAAGALTRPSLSGPRRVLAIGIAGVLIAAAAAFRITVDDSWTKNLPPDSDVARGDASLNRLLAGTTRLELMVDSGRPNGILEPRMMQAASLLTTAVSRLPFVGAVHSIYDSILDVNAALHGQAYGAFRERVVAGAVHLGPAALDQTVLLISSVKRAALRKEIDDDRQRTRITVFIRSADYNRLAEVLHTVAAAGGGIARLGGRIVPFGDGWISYTTVRLLVRGQVWSIGVALLTDLVLLSLLLKSPRLGLIAIAPVAFSVLIVFAALAAARVPLGIANSMFAGIAIGIGLDFSIHLTSAYRQHAAARLPSRESLARAIAGTGPAILTSAGAIAFGFSALCASDVLPNVQLALMVCLSLIVCAVSTRVFVPSLVLAGRSA